MMPFHTRLRSAWLGFTVLLVTTFTLAFAATLHAQVLSDPRVAEFDPSPDHGVVLDSGEPAVLRYELGVYPLGSSTPVGTVDMGKPSPDPDGKIRYDFSAQVTAWSLPGGDYEARVSAIGPEGAALSDPSNPFTFTTGTACDYSLNATTVSAPALGRQLRGGRLHRHRLRVGRHDRRALVDDGDERRVGQRAGTIRGPGQLVLVQPHRHDRDRWARA